MHRSCSKVSVLMAALNEEEGIGPTIKELRKELPGHSLVVVDGNSVDRTLEIAEELGAKVLIQKGKGKGDALNQALKSLDSGVQYVVFIDADFTYPAEYLPKMIETLKNNQQLGMIVGNRFNGQHNFDESINSPFYFGNRMLAFAQHVINGIKLDDPLSGLRVVRRQILDNWKIKSKGFDVEAEMNFHVERAGYHILELPIKYRSRLGEKKLKLRHGFEILKRMIEESLLIKFQK